MFSGRVGDPRRVPSNFRYQVFIDEEIREAKRILAEENISVLSSAQIINIALAFLEVGGSAWDKVVLYANVALEKEANSYNPEILATIHYMLTTQKREQGDYARAHAEGEIAWGLAQSDWLKSNILRCIGLIYLNEKNYVAAAIKFKEAFDFVNDPAKRELRGSLAALSNYYGLALAKGALQTGQDPDEGLKVLEETTRLYESLFAELDINEATRLKLNDWQSHVFHRGMLLTMRAEKCEDKADARVKFQEAEILLEKSLEGRIANNADDRRLGDVYAWLGRASKGLEDYYHAKLHFELALQHLTRAFAKTPDAKEIKEVQDWLSDLQGKIVIGITPVAAGQSLFVYDARASSTAGEQSTTEPQTHFVI